MPTINQLMRHGREVEKIKSKSPAMKIAHSVAVSARACTPQRQEAELRFA